MLKAKEEFGKRYGKLTVIERAGSSRFGSAIWKCSCECGANCLVRGGDLRNGSINNCGKVGCMLGISGDSVPSMIDAYISGHFDGEGCISFLSKGEKLPYLVARVTVTYKPILLEYESEFGGRIYKNKRNGVDNHKQEWSWHLSERLKLISFIRRIIPFSREKRSQLSLALDFLIKRMDQRQRTTPEFKLGVFHGSEKLSEMKRFNYAN